MEISFFVSLFQRRENPSKRSCEGDKRKNISADETTHNPVNNESNGKVKSWGNESRKEDAGKDLHKETTTEPNIPDKSNLPDTPENPGSLDAIQVVPDKYCHSVETSSAPEESEMSNTPHTPKNLEKEDTNTEEE